MTIEEMLKALLEERLGPVRAGIAALERAVQENAKLADAIAPLRLELQRLAMRLSGTVPPAASARMHGGREIVSISRVEVETGLHRTTIYRRYRQGAFPEPFYVADRRCWYLEDVLAWVEAEKTKPIPAPFRGSARKSGA